MTDCPIIISASDRLTQSHRPASFVRSGPESHAKGAMRLRSTSNPLAKLEPLALIPRAGASLPSTISADSALSP